PASRRSLTPSWITTTSRPMTRWRGLPRGSSVSWRRSRSSSSKSRSIFKVSQGPGLTRLEPLGPVALRFTFRDPHSFARQLVLLADFVVAVESFRLEPVHQAFDFVQH